MLSGVQLDWRHRLLSGGLGVLQTMTTMTTTNVLPSMSGRRVAVRTALSTVERLIFRGDAMVVARANAWSAVQHDRERARQRAEAWAALDDHLA
jgi:hypothetical protein